KPWPCQRSVRNGCSAVVLARFERMNVQPVPGQLTPRRGEHTHHHRCKTDCRGYKIALCADDLDTLSLETTWMELTHDDVHPPLQLAN
ncbi:MAG: hypothetical protein AAFO75_07020, partial [Pseudomonadota bacterium]